MIQVFLLILNYLLPFSMGIGFGRVLGLIQRWKSKVNSQRLALEVLLICLFGIPEVAWDKLSLAIPKHSFLIWLAFRDAIVTKHKMSGWGYTGDVNCLFSHGSMEDRNHLFFGCSFSRRVWRSIMAACLFDNLPLFWDDIMKWSIAMLHGRNLKSCLGRSLCFGAVAYHI
jgi:hypothetical protein